MRCASFPQVTELAMAAALPRIDAPSARAFNRLYDAHAAMPVLLGRHDCTLAWQLPPGSLGTDAFEIYGFQIGRQAGHLGLDPLAHSLLLNERRATLLPRELRYVLLADALNPLVQALEQAMRQHFEWTLPGCAQGPASFNPLRAACFELRAASADATGHRCGGYVQFDDSSALDKLSAALCSTPEPGPEIEWISLPVTFELGRTLIRLQEISGIRCGDIIGIEQWQSQGTAIGARLVLGHGHASSVTALIDDTRITLQPWKEFTLSSVSTPHAAPADAKETTGVALGRLDSMEVVLRFEVGDLSVSLRELRSIRPGHVFELAQPLNNSTVRIFAHGNMLGTGHLVAVGDRLGIRVVEFAPDAHE